MCVSVYENVCVSVCECVCGTWESNTGHGTYKTSSLPQSCMKCTGEILACSGTPKV